MAHRQASGSVTRLVRHNLWNACLAETAPPWPSSIRSSNAWPDRLGLFLVVASVTAGALTSSTWAQGHHDEVYQSGVHQAGAHPSLSHLVRGHVRAADTGAELPAATVQISGTYRGTIANDDGEYLLELPHLPATVRVTYIGYESQELLVADPTVGQLDFAMNVSPYRMPETVVRPEEARRIMAEVIRRKREWRPRIERYRADAYSRFVVENAMDIVVMGEVVSELYWDQEKGRREVVVSRRMTQNAQDEGGGDEYFSAMEGFINLYDDDLPFLEHRIIGPTHPDALDHYHFRLVGRRAVDDQLVYDIDVRPRSRLQMAFVGHVAVLDGEYALMEVNLTPNRAALASAMPIPFIERLDVTFRQQFRGFEGGVWLPVDYRMGAALDMGMVGLQLPVIKLDMVTRLTEYDVVNVELPDTLYASEQKLHVDTLAVEADSTFTRFADPIPLTPREREAYTTLDTSFSIEEAFRPTGFLTRFMDLDDEDEEERDRKEGRGVQISAGVSSEDGAGMDVRRADAESDTTGVRAAWRRYRPRVDWRAGYNRVSEGYLGAELRKDLPPSVRARGEVGYHTGLERTSFGGELIYGFGEHKRSSVRLDYRDRLESTYRTDTYPDWINSLQVAAGLDDYFDYYWGESVEASAEYAGGRRRLAARLGLRRESTSPVGLTTRKDLLRRDARYRDNPESPELDLREVTLRLSVGGDYVPFGVAINRRARLRVEHGAGWLGSDASYTRVDVDADYHIKTFWRRRWVPNALDVRLVAGTHAGDLPVQRLMAVDGAIGPLSPFGVLRSIHGQPYAGDQYAALYWEHNFRTTPFEFLGLWPLVQRGFGFVAYGAAARTWMDDGRLAALGYAPRLTDRTHHEVGLSLLAYHLFRLDVTRRLDEEDWSVGVGIARFGFD